MCYKKTPRRAPRPCRPPARLLHRFGFACTVSYNTGFLSNVNKHSKCEIFISHMDSVFIIAGATVIHVPGVLAAGHALLHKEDSRSALGWVSVCVLVPVLGALLYVLFGISRVNSRASRLMRRAAVDVLGGLADLYGGFLSRAPFGFVPHERLPEDMRFLAVPGNLITGRAVAGGNSVEPLHNGEQAYPIMLEAVAAARKRVYLSTYIFGRDAVGAAFAEALAAAARRGVDVRVLTDGIGSFPLFFPCPPLFWKHMLRDGVRTARFLPPSIMPPQVLVNLRTHRKVLICDGEIAFTGGMNISSRHLVAGSGPDRVQDLHFCCRGPVALQLTAAFLLDWDFVTGDAAQTPLERPALHGKSLCRVLMDGPGTQRAPITDLFCAMIGSARRSVRIMSPYFLPPPALSGALCGAVRRGVRVDVILPGLNNHCLVDWAMQHAVPPLARSGVNLYRQPPPFAHTKLLLVDETYTLMGSANLDPRSLDLNFELVVEVFDRDLAGRLTVFFDDVRSRSTHQAPDAPLPSLAVRLRNAASGLFSPYL